MSQSNMTGKGRDMRILFALLMAAVLAASPAAAEWTMHRYDETHQGYVPAAINKEFGVFTTEWWANRSIGATVKASPIVSEGRTFIGAWDNFLYALDSESGSELWRFNAASKITGTAASSEATVYVVTEAGLLFAINAKTGVKEREVAVGATFGSPTVHERRVFIGTNGGTVSAYEGDTLSLIWTFSLAANHTFEGSGYRNVIAAGQVEGAPAVYNGRVYFGSTNQHFYSVSEQGAGNGKTTVQWIFKAQGAIRGSPAIDKENSRVLFGAQDGKLYSVSLASTGYSETPAWTHAQIAGPSLPSQIQSTPAIAYGRAYFGANNGNIVAVFLNSGQQNWSKSTAGQAVSSPAVANHHVIVGSSDRSIYMLNATTGAVEWTKAASSAIEASPAIVGTQAFWASTDGQLFSWGGAKPSRPDFVVSQIQGALTVGVPGNIFATVKNEGTEPSVASDVQFHAIEGGTARLLTTQQLPALQPGAQQRVSASITASAPMTLRVVVDSSNAVKETDEGNNVKDQSIPVSAPLETTASSGGAPGLEAALIVAVIGAVAWARRRRN